MSNVLQTSTKSTSLLDDIRCLLANSVHRRLNMLCRYDGNDGGIDDGQTLNSIEKELLGNTATYIFGHYSASANRMQ